MGGTATISWINSTPNYDVDAQLYFDNTGIDSSFYDPINTLFLAAKANGWWDLCYAIYMMVGGTDVLHKWNAKDPRDLDAAYRLVFSGGWTHSSTGALPNGTTGYASTFLTPDGLIGLNNSHLSYYSRTSSAGAAIKVEIGGNTAYLPQAALALYGDTGQSTYYWSDYNVSGGALTTTSTPTSLIYQLGTRRSSTDAELYRNGSSIVTNTNAQGQVTSCNIPLYIGAFNHGGVAEFFSDRECAFATIGVGVSGAIAALMYADIQAFETTLGRQI